MEFYGLYRHLLARIYQRCVGSRWFGPELDSPTERAERHVPNAIYSGFLSEAEIRKDNPFLQEIRYQHTINHRSNVTVVDLSSDVRLQRFGYPPATPEHIAHTEAAIGFELPQILRDLYTQIANGGFGYWIGFVGVAGGSGSGDLQTIDVDTRKNTWKLTDRAPDGLIGWNAPFMCFELPDRFIPWVDHGCAIASWIDGWTGRVYKSGVYATTPITEPTEEVFDPVWLHDVMPTPDERADDIPTEEYARFEAQDGLSMDWEEADIESEAYDGPEWCYGLHYEAASIEEWLIQWLENKL